MRQTLFSVSLFAQFWELNLIGVNEGLLEMLHYHDFQHSLDKRSCTAWKIDTANLLMAEFPQPSGL